MAEPIPREAKLVSLLLNASGIQECEPKVIHQMLEFMYKCSTDVLQDALVYSDHAQKTELDTDDLRLAMHSYIKRSFIPPPSNEFMMELANRRNAIPLPLVDEAPSLRLPADENCLLAANYKITTLRNKIGRVGEPQQSRSHLDESETHKKMRVD